MENQDIKEALLVMIPQYMEQIRTSLNLVDQDIEKLRTDEYSIDSEDAREVINSASEAIRNISTFVVDLRSVVSRSLVINEE